LGRRPLGAILHSSNEPGELSQWLCHDDSTINIVVLIIIIIIIIIHIQKEGQQAMNRDEGSYQLSHAYDRFLDTASSRCVKNRKNWVSASSDEGLW